MLLSLSIRKGCDASDNFLQNELSNKNLLTQKWFYELSGQIQLMTVKYTLINAVRNVPARTK